MIVKNAGKGLELFCASWLFTVFTTLVLSWLSWVEYALDILSYFVVLLLSSVEVQKCLMSSVGMFVLGIWLFLVLFSRACSVESWFFPLLHVIVLSEILFSLWSYSL